MNKKHGSFLAFKGTQMRHVGPPIVDPLLIVYA
jgi:hypothetical protein